MITQLLVPRTIPVARRAPPAAHAACRPPPPPAAAATRRTRRTLHGFCQMSFKCSGGSDRARLNSHRQSDRQCRPRRVRQFITCPPCRWPVLLHPGGYRSEQEPFRFALQSKLGGACQKRGAVPRCTCGCARGVPAEPGDEVRRGVGELQCTTLKWSSTFGPSPFTL